MTSRSASSSRSKQVQTESFSLLHVWFDILLHVVDMAVWINTKTNVKQQIKVQFTKPVIYSLQIWQCVMSRGEWNKKEELLAEQAAKHLRHYTPLLAAFAQSAKAEIALLTKVCYPKGCLL